MMLRGATNGEIAAALGVSLGMVAVDIDVIFEDWLADARRVSKMNRAKAVKRLELSALKAMSSFERSRKDAEETQTVITPRRCPDCKGIGVDKSGLPCDTCGGTGKVKSEIVTRRIKGQAGDAAFLARFNDSVREIARLEGLYEEPQREASKTEVHIHQEQIDLSRAPPEMLLEAMSLWDRMTKTMAIPVESVPVIEHEENNNE